MLLDVSPLTGCSLLAHPSVALIFVVAAFMSAVNGFHRPALDAMTPRLVDLQDLTAVSALGTTLRTTRILELPPRVDGGRCAILNSPLKRG